MCTFKDERTVQVCDVAIEKVRGTLAGAFGSDVSFTHVEGGGTLIKAAAAVDPEGFSRLAREAIASAEQAEAEHASTITTVEGSPVLAHGSDNPFLEREPRRIDF